MTLSPEASSPSEAPADAPAPAEASPDVSQVSSPAEDSGVKSEPKLLDVLRDAVKPAEDPGTQTPASEATKDEPAEADAKAETAVEPDDSKLPFAKHPRWQQVKAARDDARTKFTEASTKLAETEQRLQDLGPKAQEFDAIDRFRQSNGLTHEDIAEALLWRGHVKNNPDEAIKLLMPVVTKLMTDTGRLLPQDLHKEVEEGRITEERARELSQARAGKVQAETRAQQVETGVQSERVAEAARQLGQDIESATNDWEKRTKEKDPDFNAKQPFVMDRVRVIVATDGLPKSKQEVETILARAHKDVTENFRKYVPAKPEIRRKPADSPSVEARPAPTSLKDAIRVGLGG